MSKKKSKIRGKLYSNMRKKNKNKVEKTIEKMQKIRDIDSCNLRDLLNDKLKWAIAEKQKAVQQIEQLKIQAHRLDGVILLMKDLCTEKDKENK